MRTLSHSTQWRKRPYCLTFLIVEPAHISEPACRGLGGFFFFLFFPPLSSTFFSVFFISSSHWQTRARCGAGWGVLAVSRPSWQWSVVAEVFSLNLFVGLFSLTASFHCANSAPQRSKVAHWGAMCCGLGPCNQHTLVLYVVVIIPRVLLHLSVCMWADVFGTVFPGGFLPVSYLDIARWSWGDQTSLSGLLTCLQRTEYVCLIEEGSVIWAGCCSLASDGYAATLLFTWRANLDTSRPLLLGVVERFWLQSDAVVCVLVGLCLNWTHTGLERRLGHGGLWRAGGWLFTIGLLVHMVPSNHR
uniref:Uncharacterized protein n=1 Tax=Hucho hucho TaxID=62062 RepID=A0A4W5N068_9TELE